MFKSIIFTVVALAVSTMANAQDESPIQFDVSDTQLSDTAVKMKTLEEKIIPIFEEEGYPMEDAGCRVQVTIGPDGKPRPTVICGGSWSF